MNDFIYISGALFMSKNLGDLRKLYEFAAGECERSGHAAYVPHKHTDPELRADADPRDIYEIDSQKVMTAKGIIAFANEPSFGTGMELMLAAQHNVPVIYFRHSSVQISRYLRGFMMKHGYGDAISYENEADLADKIANWLAATYIKAA